MLTPSPQPSSAFTGFDSIVNTKQEIFMLNEPNNCISKASLVHSPRKAGTNHRFNHHHSLKKSSNLLKPQSPRATKGIIKNGRKSSSGGNSNPSPNISFPSKMYSGDSVVANHNANNDSTNFYYDRLNSNSNRRSLVSSSNSRGETNVNYDLISHGLTDSVCETVKLLKDDFGENNCPDGGLTASAASISSDISSSSSGNSCEIGEHTNHTVFTYAEEVVVISPSANQVGASSERLNKLGIMKTFASSSSSPSSTDGDTTIVEVTPQPKIQEHPLPILKDEQAIIQVNESEEKTTSIQNKQESSLKNNNDDPNGCDEESTIPALIKVEKVTNTTKGTSLKRVSFGSSGGSMVETLIYESNTSDICTKSGNKIVTVPVVTNGSTQREVIRHEEAEVHTPVESTSSKDLSGGSGSRPPSRVRVTFFESEKPLAVNSPDSDAFDFDFHNMTLIGSPVHDGNPPSNLITVEGWDNPFRPDGNLSKEADQIVELIKEGKPINDETLRSKSPSVNETMDMTSSFPTQSMNVSPQQKEVNGSASNGTTGPLDVQHTVVLPAAQAGQVEHVVLKKKKGCCVIQ